MFQFFRKLLRKDPPQSQPQGQFQNQAQTQFQDLFQDSAAQQRTPTEIVLEGMPPLAITEHTFFWLDGFPYPESSDIDAWLEKAADEQTRTEALMACERAWLLHFAAALGSDYRLSESGNATLISTATPGIAKAKLDYMEQALKRVYETLKGLAKISRWKENLILFDDREHYYRYASVCFPKKKESDCNSGLYVPIAYGHFITMANNDLSQIEPLTAYNMTFSCLSHLSTPYWVKEGLAANVKKWLTGRENASTASQGMHEKHLKFWGASEIQEFWSGHFFSHAKEDDYPLGLDLARILVEQLAQDWSRFQTFALAADERDSGARAAREVFGIRLGAWVASMFEKEDAEAFEPLEREETEQEETNA